VDFAGVNPFTIIDIASRNWACEFHWTRYVLWPRITQRNFYRFEFMVSLWFIVLFLFILFFGDFNYT